MRAAGRMIDHRFPIGWGPGRHGPGDNVFTYFVDPQGFRTHYETTASRIAGRLTAGGERGELKAQDEFGAEVRAWAMMGMNVFLGLRFGVWGDEDPAAVAAEVNALLRRGLEP